MYKFTATSVLTERGDSKQKNKIGSRPA